MPKKAIRKIRIDGQVAYVPLSQGYEAIIDVDDVGIIEGFNWYAQVAKRHNLVYAVRGAILNGTKKQVSMHRQILNAKDGFDVDHSNGNGIDNRRKNIRIATRSQNMHNKKMQHNNTSGYKGVHWNKGRGKWQANIKVNDKRRYLGSFDTPEDAAEAYKSASERLHLDFARLA